MPDDDAPSAPLLRVISGNATDEEVAAVLAVVLARTQPQVDDEPAATSTWTDPAARHRNPPEFPRPGRDGWRTSYWPR